MTALAFIDTETTGTDPDLHQVWEVAYILADHDPDQARLTISSRQRFVDAGVDLTNADPMALQISRFHQRRHDQIAPPAGGRCPSATIAQEVARDTAGRHLVGAVPAFDAAFLTRMLRRHGTAPAWHYHLIDVEALVAGYLQGFAAGTLRHAEDATSAEVAACKGPSAAPWKSTDLAEAVGVTTDPASKHTALGDATWAMRQYATVYDLAVVTP